MNRLIYNGYHGTYRKFPDKDIKSFGGIHVGTYKAAMDRLINTFASEGGGWIGKNKPGYIYPVTVHCRKCTKTINETELFGIINIKSRIDEIIKNGYDCISYINSVEDKGSISILIIYRAIITVGSPEIVDVKKIMCSAR